MSLFDHFGGGAGRAQPQAQQQPDPMAMLQQLRTNPGGTLEQNTRFRIPSGMSSSEEIQQHLLQTKQVTPAQYQRALSIARGLMRGK